MFLLKKPEDLFFFVQTISSQFNRCIAWCQMPDAQYSQSIVETHCILLISAVSPLSNRNFAFTNSFLASASCSIWGNVFVEAFCLIFHRVSCVAFSDDKQAIQRSHHTHCAFLAVVSLFHILRLLAYISLTRQYLLAEVSRAIELLAWLNLADFCRYRCRALQQGSPERKFLDWVHRIKECRGASERVTSPRWQHQDEVPTEDPYLYPAIQAISALSHHRLHWDGHVIENQETLRIIELSAKDRRDCEVFLYSLWARESFIALADKVSKIIIKPAG